jgi:type IV pilus assembly protein PilY1
MPLVAAAVSITTQPTATSLEDIFTEIVREILVDNSSFTAPSIAVNAFNRTQNLNDLYMSVFKPSLNYRWIGNVKKYRLTPEGDIVDQDGKSAVDASTGFFATGTRSYWSAAVDGPDASLGGRRGNYQFRQRALSIQTSATPAELSPSLIPGR